MILVVLVLTVGFLALYALGTALTFDEVNSLAADDQLDDRVLAGSTLFGLAMFTILFLGAVLGVFLTLGAVRGDAERGLLQPIVVRPVGRTSLLLGRYGGAAVCVRRLRGRRLRRGDGDHRVSPATGGRTTRSAPVQGWCSGCW